jgi:hypothetical protein
MNAEVPKKIQLRSFVPTEEAEMTARGAELL